MLYDFASWLMTAVTVACGALLILMVGFDIIATVLNPEVESPLSTRFQLVLWKMLRALQRRLTPRHEGRDEGRSALNWGLPLMVSGLIVLWLVVIACGFALIYYPWIGDPQSFISPVRANKSFVKALYFSSVTLATLGYGDIQPLSWPFRVLCIVEGFSGAVGIGLQVAYVLGVFPSFSRLRTVGVSLDAEVAGQSSGIPMARRYMAAPGEWNPQLSARLHALAQDILAITEAHETHPVLYYAHPRRVQHSFLRILATAQGLVALLRYGLSPDRHASMVRDPSLLLLEQALHYSLRRLNASITISESEQSTAAARLHLEGAYNLLCDQIEAMGLTSSREQASAPVPVLVEAAVETLPGEAAPEHSPEVLDGSVAGTPAEPSGPQDGVAATEEEIASSILDPALDLTSDSALEAFLAFRAETDPYLATYANACGYSVEAATSDQQTSWWVGSR